MTHTQREETAVHLKSPIDSLRDVMDDIETEWIDQERLGWRLKAVELSLRRLRDAA